MERNPIVMERNPTVGSIQGFKLIAIYIYQERGFEHLDTRLQKPNKN